jgi:O-antigen/teichoic acid export membrane protein
LRLVVARSILWWLSGPLATPLLAMLRPRLLLFINIFIFLFLLAGNALVIPLYGPLGTAWLNVIAYASVEVVLLWSAFTILKSPVPHTLVGVYSEGAAHS